MADYNIELINDTEYTIKLNEQGPQGATGPRGPQGEQGLQGVKGDKGDTATIEVGDTETLPAKTNAYVMNTGTINDAVLEFGIPKGYSPTIEEDVNTETEYKLKIVNEDNEFITPNLRSQSYIPYATQEEAIAGTREDVVISPATAKDVAYNYIGKITQLGFNGVLESGVVTFTPDVDTPYDIKEGYEYEIDLLFPAAGVLPDTTKLVIKNNNETINLVNVKHSDSTQAIEYGDMKQVCRYDNEIGWRWIFNARFAITDAGNKVFVIPSTVTDTPSNVVTTDTNQNITGAKNFINSATSTTPDAHTGMSITLKNDQAELGADSTNSDGSVNFKYQGVRFVDKNNEEVASLYSAPDGVGGSFTRLNASAKVDGEYVDGFVELEVDANGKTHFYVPEVDEDSTVNGTQAATVDYVKAHAGGLEIGTIVTMPFGVDESENKYRYLNGQILIQSQFTAFTTKVKSWQTTRPNLFTTEDNWQAEKTASEFGIVDKFVIDDEAGTIRLPKYPEYIVAGADKVKGNGITLGLTDGTSDYGTFGNLYANQMSRGLAGIVDGAGSPVNTSFATSSFFSGQNKTIGITTDSSKSGMVTNQEVVKCYYVIVVNTGVEEAERPINNYQVNNVYSYGVSQYYKGVMNNNSWLRSAGQWNSGTVYNGVYEWAVAQQVAGVDGFKLSTEEYTDYDWVVNTEEQTFRLPLLDGSEDIPSSQRYVYTNPTTSGQQYTAMYNGIIQLNAISSAANQYVRLYNTTTGQNVEMRTPGSSAGNICSLQVKAGDVFEVFGDVISTINWLANIKYEGNGNLYYYIGDVLENADLINIARLGEELVDKVDKTSTTDREEVISWGIPDYSSAVTLTVGTTNVEVDFDGVILYPGLLNNAVHYFYVNNINIGSFGGTQTTGAFIYVPVQKGDLVKSSATLNFILVPFKGGNNA